MNKSKKFFSGLLLIPLMILLSGCLEKAEAPTKTDEVVTADTILDNQLLTDAATNNNLATCKSIADKVKEAECEKVVNANLITLQALQKKSASTCNSIKLERYKEVCKEKVDATVKADEQQKIQQQAIKTDYQKAQAAQDSGNVSQCKEVKDKNIEETCELNILVNKAIQAQDKTICEQGSTESIQKQCSDGVK